MIIHVVTLNQHRCNALIASLLKEALLLAGHAVVSDITHKDIDFIIAINGAVDNTTADIVENIRESHKKVALFIDDVDIPPAYGADVYVEQFFKDGADVYIEKFFKDGDRNCISIQFPIAELLTLHKDWGITRQETKKPFEWFYGGTVKQRRCYDAFFNNSMVRHSNMLLAGDDEEWDYIANVNAASSAVSRVATIRDLDTLYNIMRLCKNTAIVYDELHYGNGLPLRFFEAALCNMNVFVFDEKGDYIFYTAEQIKQLYTKKQTVSKIKGLMWNIKQLM